MQKGDVRAVENPIAAVFDLAEEVNEQAPKIRKAIGYSRLFIMVWLFADFVLLVFLSGPGGPFAALSVLALTTTLFVAALALRWSHGPVSRTFLFVVIVVTGIAIALSHGAGFLLGGLLAGLFVLGVVILNLMKDLRAFFNYYALRHRAIRSVRDEDPVVYVPKGEDAVERLLNYFSERHPEVRQQAQAGRVQTPALLKGRSGLVYSFDGFIHGTPSALWKPFGLGETGYAIFIKAFTETPTAKDLRALKRAVEDVCQVLKVPPTRVIALWTPPDEPEALSDEAYNLLTSEVVTYRRAGTDYRCSLELIMESPDGTYDFIPFVTEALYA
ncbi:MAG: hypothetical protein LN410_02615 [Candidatus Thermoplasmatota archaeon]|nr:hypothetical protein [Candidatus Thermoplasmatota archaeon]